MGWNSAANPTGWVTVSSAKHASLFLDTDTLTFTLSVTTAVAYEVRDYYGTIVRSGTPSGTTLTLAALPLGWYCLYLYQAGTDATYGSLIGKRMFSVLKTDARLVSPPAAGTIAGGELAFQGQDHIVRGVALIGPYRNQIDDAAAPTTGGYSIVRTQEDRGYQRTYYEANPDSARPRPTFLQFPNGTASTGQSAGVTSVVAALYPDIPYFEGPANEPDLRNAAIATDMQTFKASVKAGNASAKVMGPNPVQVTASRPGYMDFDSFLALGGGAGLDALSFHAYNAVNGDLVHGRRTMNRFTRVLSDRGYGSVELWQTEWGQHAATYGVFDPRRQCQWWAAHRFLMDQYGIPKERDYWFYDTAHGFWNFPSFWKLGGGDCMPLVAMMRVYAQEVYGRTWTAKLDFGTVENDFYIGSKYTAADGSAILSLLSAGRTDGTVRLLVTGATSLQVVDCFGTVSTITRDGSGIATVPIGMEPCYVRLPAGVTATVEQVAYGLKVSALGTKNTALGTVDAKRVTNGTLENAYYDPTNEPTEFRDDAALPATLTVNLRQSDAVTRTSPVDCVIVNCPAPWQSQASLLDFDVEYQDAAGAWHTLQTITEPTKTFSAPTNQTGGAGCFYDSYYSNRSVFVLRFASVIAQAVRLRVRDATCGGEATAAAEAAGGQGNSVKKIVVRELAVYSRDVLVARPVLVRAG